MGRSEAPLVIPSKGDPVTTTTTSAVTQSIERTWTGRSVGAVLRSGWSTQIFKKGNKHLVQRGGKPGFHWDNHQNRIEFDRLNGWHFNEGVGLGATKGSGVVCLTLPAEGCSMPGRESLLAGELSGERLEPSVEESATHP